MTERPTRRRTRWYTCLAPLLHQPATDRTRTDTYPELVYLRRRWR